MKLEDYDYSSYEPDESEIYYAHLNNRDEIRYDAVPGTAVIDEEEKRIKISSGVFDIYKSFDEDEIELQKNEVLESMIDYDPDCERLDHFTANIDLQLGDGIIDFIYADLHESIEKAANHYYEMKRFTHWFVAAAKEHCKQQGWTPSDDKEESVKTKPSIRKREDLNELEDMMLDETIFMINPVLRASLYTMLCPPLFIGDDEMKSFRAYANYLEFLQNLYREQMEFCFDEDFYPDILGGKMPHERFGILRSLKSYPVSAHFKECFSVSHFMDYRANMKMPYAISSDRFLEGVKRPFSEDENRQIKELNERYHYDEKLVTVLFQLHRFITKEYLFHSLDEILELEFSKMLEFGMRFRKCKRCGKYFCMKGNYNTRYCDHIQPGETKTCQEIAAKENYKEKVASDPAIAIYNRYYKRYAARVKVRQIKEEAFKSWKYQAITKRDDCSQGIITPEEYTGWMESAFPNRKKKE